MSVELMHKLCITLEKMEELYARVLPILDLERKSLAEMNFERLFEELREKDEILSLIKKLDKERLNIQDHFAMLNETPKEAMSLKFFAEQLLEGSPEDKDIGARMMSVRGRIHDLIQEAQIKIKNNERFIEKSVQNIRGLAEAVTQTVETGQEKQASSKGKNYSTYGKNAKVKKNSKSGSIVSGHV